jgi:hypothetical protein
MDISVLVVNLNNLELTKNCVIDLMSQDCEFNLTIIDQNSSEEGTKEYFKSLPENIEFIKNERNVPLNHLWNWFVINSDTPYICLLNNDVRIAPSFLSSAIKVFEKEPNVGFVNHVSNNKDYQECSDELNYKVIETPYRQGWDPIFRKECYNQIPNELSFFYGADYIYSKLYSSGIKGAYILNSPMIHFGRSTTVEKGGQRDASPDGSLFSKLDLEFKNMSFVEDLSKWKPEFNINNFFLCKNKEVRKNNMKKTYITHVTRDYLEVALNLVKSVSLFSDLPIIVYFINLQEEDKQKFNEYKNVQLRNIDLDISEKTPDDYITVDSGNFYINRYSARIYNILCAKTIAMEMALEEGFDEVCYLDSDCLATPLVDELFNWMSNVTDYPIATQGIHEYMIWTDNGVQSGNPFAGGSPYADNKLCLEWPLMSFLEVGENERGSYRTTGIMLMNQKCLPFIKIWRELCFILPKLVNIKKYATYHEETIYNVLSWKKTNQGFPLCYINLGEGFETVKHFYSDKSTEGQSISSNGDISQNFYKIPDNKRDIKVLHGEKRTSEVNLILDYLVELKNNNYFND